jgi:hypothetical protein
MGKQKCRRIDIGEAMTYTNDDRLKAFDLNPDLKWLQMSCQLSLQEYINEFTQEVDAAITHYRSSLNALRGKYEKHNDQHRNIRKR